jgi:hypothetical protein
MPFRMASRAIPPAAYWSHEEGRAPGSDFWMEESEPGLVQAGWRDWASYQIRFAGTERATVEAVSVVSEQEAALAFAFSILPLVLPYWGIEPFHGSAVLHKGSAVILLGPSGSGKSSIASALESMGMPLLTDDASAIDERLTLWPGPAALNPRWSEAPQDHVSRYNEKLVLAPAQYWDQPAPVSAVVVLDRGSVGPFELRGVEAADRVRRILGNTRHGSFLKALRQEVQFRVATSLASLPMCVANLPDDPNGPLDAATRIRDWLGSIGR